MTVAVLGAGAWGTALATVAARAGNDVVLWGRDAASLASVERERENSGALPGVTLHPAIRATAESEGLGAAAVVLAAVPAQALRETLLATRSQIRPGTPIVVCAKGIEQSTGLLLSDVVRALMPDHPPAALSGPSFARDVALGLPTAVTLAADTAEQAAGLAERLATPTFRLYHTDDLRGVEIGGAVKNVLAIACGITQGRGLGASAVAALMARAFAELVRFGRSSGARPETLMGLSGFGDLVLTCGSPQSRNFALGLALGRGDLSTSATGPLAEGVATAPILIRKANEQGVAMPIAESVAGILSGRIDVDGAIERLLSRPPKAEL